MAIKIVDFPSYKMVVHPISWVIAMAKAHSNWNTVGGFNQPL